MNVNPLMSKVAIPYARALFDFSVEKNIMHQVTADFQNLDVLLNETIELIDVLNNPVISNNAKAKILEKTIKSEINLETFKFLMVLIERDRINLLPGIISNYLNLVYETASVKMVEVVTAFEFSTSQKETLIQKLKELTNAREIRLTMTIEPNLIGGFLVKTNSKVLDFTIKNQLTQLAKHLDATLEI